MKTKWLRLTMIVGLVLAISGVVGAVPTAPALPLTMNGTTGAITWGPAAVSFNAGSPYFNVIEYYEWELRLNGNPTAVTRRANSTQPPEAAATWNGVEWSDTLVNGTAGSGILPLQPGRYQLAVRAYDLDEPVTVQGDWRLLDQDVLPATPVVSVVEEVWAPDGTYTISWTPDQTAVVEEVLVEWTFDGWTNTYSSGWDDNTGSYTTGRIAPTSFWEPVTVRVTTRDSQSGLESLPGTTVHHALASDWAPTNMGIDTVGAPNWVISYWYTNPAGVDTDYFIFKLDLTFNGSSSDITQGTVDIDKNFSIDFNPVTNSTLNNIFGHAWVYSISAWDLDEHEAGTKSSDGVFYSLAAMGTVTKTFEDDEYPWTFHVSYHDPYNDAKWVLSGGIGYLTDFDFLFEYDATTETELEEMVGTPSGVGEVDFTVYPDAFTNANFINKYNDWSLSVQPHIDDAPREDDHYAAAGELSFETVCPEFDAPTAGYSEYWSMGLWYQVPEYPIDGLMVEQGINSGIPVRTIWNLPSLPIEDHFFYGNTSFLRSFVDWDVSLDNLTFDDFPSDTRWFMWADNDENLPGRTNLTAPAGEVRFYDVHVNMQYDNGGDGEVGYIDVSDPALIDQFQVDNQNPGPVTDEEIAQDPVTETYGSPWLLSFTTPIAPDFEQYRPILMKSGTGGMLLGDFYVPVPPDEDVTWTVTEDMWDNQIQWALNPFGTYNLYVDTYDNTVPIRMMYDDNIAFSFPYTLHIALGNVLDLTGTANKVSIEFLYKDRVRAGWKAVNHKPFGLDPDLIHYVAQLFYYDTVTSNWLEVDNTDEVYPYDPLPGDLIADPRMYADFNAGDFDFPEGKYKVIVHYYYNTTDEVAPEGDGVSDEFEIIYEGVSMAAPTWNTDYTTISWVDPTLEDPVLNIMEYEIIVLGTNGLIHKETTTGTWIEFLPETWWPDTNVYEATYTAFVRCLDNLDRLGDWSPASAGYDLELPDFKGLAFLVVDSTGSAPTSPTRLRDLYLKWDEYTAEPEGFFNWDPALVSFQIRIALGGDATGALNLDIVEINNGSTNVHVPVGEEGKLITYVFRVDMFYDGVFLDQIDPVISAQYNIDLKGPAAVDLADVIAARPAYYWTFGWTPAAAIGIDDAANTYDLVVSRLEGTDGTVDASVTIPVFGTAAMFDPRNFFDEIFGNFSYTVIPYDNLLNVGTPVTKTFTFAPPSLGITGLTLDETEVEWNAIVEATKYDVELVSQNGHETWYGLTTNSQTIDWATVFPGANVYTIWKARVRAYDRDGNVGAWSNYVTHDFELPKLSGYPFEVLLTDMSTAPMDTPMSVRQLVAQWDGLSLEDAPVGFINFDRTHVTFDFQVDAISYTTDTYTTWHYILAGNTYSLGAAQTVDVGVEGDVVQYRFYLQPLYDGVPMLNNWEMMSPYIIDLKAPAAPINLEHNIGVAPWEFTWEPGLEEYEEGNDDGPPALVYPDGGFAGYTFQLQKVDPETGLVINNYLLDLTDTSTLVDPLQLNWSVFGDYRWRVHAYDVFGNTSVSEWLTFNYTLDSAIGPTGIQYTLLGEGRSLLIEPIVYATHSLVKFAWDTPEASIVGLEMEDVDYVFELMRFIPDLQEWVNVKEYSLTWNPGHMESEVSVGITGWTIHYKGRVRVEYRGEHTDWMYSDEFAIDLDRPSTITGGADYSSTVFEYPIWSFTWDDSSEDTVGIGGFLFILERLEGDTTHAVAMLDLPYIENYDGGGYDIGGDGWWFDNYDGTFMLEMEPFEFVESIDGIFRYRVIPYDNLGNEGWGTEPAEFLSEWSGGDKYGTYPFINLYDNWMGELQDIGLVNNNTYATISFDIFGLDSEYELEFWLNGNELVEGVDFMLLDSPYGSDLYYLVLLESVRDIIQEDGCGELEISAYIVDEGLIVQFTVDAFDYIYHNQRTGFGFGRFRPALDN